MRDPIVVVGAGVGGLSAAIRLAVAGLPVRIFEKNATAGGKVSERVDQGFRWDAGPSVVTMRAVFEGLFAATGRRMEDYVRLNPVEPLTRYFFSGGSQLDAVRDPQRMDDQIAAIDKRDVAGYRRFLDDAKRIYDLTSPTFIYGDPPSLRTLRTANPLDFLRIGAGRTLHDAVARRVESSQMRMVLDRFATYVGASPYQAPSTLAAIAHVELGEGVWYPQGGVYQIAHALWRLAIEAGVEISTDAGVQRIEVAAGRVSGVRLRGGALVPASAVVSNLDVTETYRTLLPPSRRVRERLQRLLKAETSCSGFALLLGVEGVSPEVAHHNVWFPRAYRNEFDDLFTRQMPAEDPAIYAAITCKSDPTHAPAGCENWFILVNAPSTASRFDWRLNATEYGDHILDLLAARGPDLRKRVRVRHTVTPEDLARASGAWRGALYGISSNRAILAFRRSRNRCSDVEGLYFAGGTAHPGAGLPMVVLSGAAAARQLLADLKCSGGELPHT